MISKYSLGILHSHSELKIEFNKESMYKMIYEYMLKMV